MTNADGADVLLSDLWTGSAFSLVACVTTDGVHWSGPTTVGEGTNATAAIAPNGRTVMMWQGGPSTAPDIQASIFAPGGGWSVPATVSTAPGHPSIAMDGSGNVRGIWSPANTASAVQTASLAANSTAWTAPVTLAAAGGGVNIATNSAGDVVVGWRAQTTNDLTAASGTILGGFSTPVVMGDTTGYSYNPVPSRAAINNADQAIFVWQSTYTGTMYATRTASGTWSAATQLSSTRVLVSVAVNSDGNFVLTWTNSAGSVETVTVSA